MRKLRIFLILVLLLTGIVQTVSADGNASVSGPSVVRAGDTITVTFYAGGGILGGSGSITYDPTQLTFEDYSVLVDGNWKVELTGNNFIFYDDSLSSPINGSTAIFNMTFAVNPSAAVGTQVQVSATNVMLSDGSKDTAVGTCTYQTAIAEPLSGNCTLSSLTVSNAAISPAFSPSVTSYTASVPYAVSSLSLSAAAQDPKAKVTVSNPTLTPGGTTTVSVKVTAENGDARTYTIHVTRAQDPNYVKSTNADLKELSVDGYQLSPAFSADVTQYYVWLPYETETLSVHAEEEDGKAAVETQQDMKLIPGKMTDISVTVTAEDGTQKRYTVSAFRAPAHEEVDTFLKSEEPPEPDTEPATQPVTEPETQPTTMPATEPATLPATQPQQDEPGNESDTPTGTAVIVCVLCAAIGAAAGVIVKSAIDRKRKD